jgi:lysophospholipase L1-like esterase
MKRFLLLFIFLLIVCNQPPAFSEDILGIGDSIMMGWPDAKGTAALPGLARYLGGLKYYNGGANGDKIADTYAALPALLIAYHPSRVYSHVGSNDCRYGEVSLPAFLAVYDSINIAVKRAGADLYVGLLTPVSKCCKGTLGRTARGQQREKLWNAALEDWCYTRNVKCFAAYQDLAVNNPLLEDNLQYDSSMADGIHLSVLGYHMLSNVMYHAAVPFRGRIWGSRNYPKMGHESWKWWIISSGGSVSGDADTGMLRLLKNATAVSNVLAIVSGSKRVTVTDLVSQGNVDIYYRTDSVNFVRTAIYQAWKPYEGPFVTADQFVQIRLGNSDRVEAQVDEVKLTWESLPAGDSRNRTFKNTGS